MEALLLWSEAIDRIDKKYKNTPNILFIVLPYTHFKLNVRGNYITPNKNTKIHIILLIIIYYYSLFYL